MKFKYLLLMLSLLQIQHFFAQGDNTKWKLIWHDEFNKNGRPDPQFWNFEKGFVRNHELQWYQPENAFVKNGKLIIEGRKENKPNPDFSLEAKSWKKSRSTIEYSASSLNTSGKFEFMYGKLEVRAKIDTSMGLWPAIWTLGVKGSWPENGEVDLMESYPIQGVHYILANVASGTNQKYVAKWNSSKTPLENFIKKDPKWASKFHIWTMIWDETKIQLLLDGELLNESYLKDTYNTDGSQPFAQKQYILLNLAIGGDNGGNPANCKFPNQYVIDYVRVYQKL